MKAFFGVFSLTLLLSVFLPAKNDSGWRWKLSFTFLPLFAFAALRVDFGNDYENYELYFDAFHRGGNFVYDSTTHAEIGYQFLCYIMPSYRALLVFNAFLLCLALAVFIYRNIPQKYLWLVILLIFLNPEKNIYGNLVGIRNGLVVTGFILGLVFVQERKLLFFAILTFLLSTIHTAALLFMPIAYVVGRNTTISNREIIIWMGAFIALLAFSVSGLIDIASPIISRYFERYEYYIEDMEAHRGMLMVVSTLALAALVFILYYSQKSLLTKGQNSLVRLSLLYIISAFLGSLAMRANYFYDMFFIGTVVILFANSRKKGYLGWALVVLTISMSVYSFILWQTSSWVAGNPLYSVYKSLLGTW